MTRQQMAPFLLSRLIEVGPLGVDFLLASTRDDVGSRSFLGSLIAYVPLPIAVIRTCSVQLK